MRRYSAWPWSDERDAELLRRVAADERRKTIAFAMGVPIAVVSYHIDLLRAAGRLDYLSRPWGEPEIARLLAALDAGGHYRELAPLFGRTPAALKQRAGVARRARLAAEQAAGEDQFQLDLAA